MPKRVDGSSPSPSQAILDSAERLFAARGYSGASIADICADSHQNVGTVYWHYKNKGGLFEAVLDRGFSRFLDALPDPSALSGPPSKRLRKYFETAGKVIETHPDIFRIRLGLASLHGNNTDGAMASAQKADDFIFDHVVKVLEPVIEEYDVVDPDALTREIANLVMDMTSGILVRANWDRRQIRSGIQRIIRTVELSIAGARAEVPAAISHL